MSQSMRKQHVGQQYFDSLEKYLGEPMARSDLRDSNFNIMQVGLSLPIKMNSAEVILQKELT